MPRWHKLEQETMLFLTRKPGESILIGDDIEITVMEIKGRHVKLGFNYPADAKILRKEVYDRIQDENRAASGQAVELTKMLLKRKG
jgi:carbon storage regulator